MNSVYFRLINTFKKFFIFAAGFCPKNLAFAPKMMVLPESGGLQPLTPQARTPMTIGLTGYHTIGITDQIP